MIAKDTNLLQMIQLFQLKKCSLAFVTSEERKKEFANAKISLSVINSFLFVHFENNHRDNYEISKF